MNPSINISARRRHLSHLALPVALSCACSNGDVNLGGGLVAQNLGVLRCAESARIEGDVRVENQGQLEQLVGCEEIAGDLLVERFEGADLSPLASLRVVDGSLVLGVDPLVYPEDPDEQTAYDQLLEMGYLDSLHGLEALESVDLLQVASVRVEDFRELESLRSIEQGLILYYTPNLKRLTGLEGAPLANLSITGSPALATLEGLTFQDPSNVFQLDSVPSLGNIDAFAGITVCSELVMISGTALETLPALALVRTDRLSLDNNSALVDASGLASLVAVTEISVASNPLLRNFPALPNLSRVEFLTVSANGIGSLALDFPALQPEPRFFGLRDVELSAALVDIGSNPNLTSITAPAGFPAVQYFGIHHNERLTDVDFGTLERADLLLLEDNAVLANVTTGALATVDQLALLNNPSLDPGAFDAVQSFELVVTSSEPARP
jgi:hypothetical protein